jgi:hypothetical protein
VDPLRPRLRLGLAFSAPRNRLRRGMSATAEPTLGPRGAETLYKAWSNQTGVLRSLKYHLFNLTAFRFGELNDRKSFAVLAESAGKTNEVATVMFDDR